MKQQDKLDQQLKKNPKITTEILSELQDVQFSSGRKVNVGDIILNGFINSDREFIILHIDEIGEIYEEDYEYPDLEYPIISLKRKQK
jgi:hypothetical protein